MSKSGSVGHGGGGEGMGGPLISLRAPLPGQDAKKDDAVRKAYKYLAALHEVRKQHARRQGWLGRAGMGISLLLLLSPEL
jgi:hypothetical protein